MPPCFGSPNLFASAATASAAVELSLADALLLLTFAGVVLVLCQLHQVSQRLARLEARRSADAETTVRPAAGVPTDIAGLSHHRVAIITAAAYTTLGRPVRIVSIAESAEASHVWSLEGRRQIFASHQVR